MIIVLHVSEDTLSWVCLCEMEIMVQQCAYSRTYKCQHIYVGMEQFCKELNEILL